SQDPYSASRLLSTSHSTLPPYTPTPLTPVNIYWTTHTSSIHSQ
ncbi:7738_t:CDS:1, partial [Entrophospora sp. SA101]